MMEIEPPKKMRFLEATGNRSASKNGGTCRGGSKNAFLKATHFEGLGFRVSGGSSAARCPA